MNRLSFGRRVLPLSCYPDNGPQKLRIRKINVRQDSQSAATNRDLLRENGTNYHWYKYFTFEILSSQLIYSHMQYYDLQNCPWKRF
jgi:hypothetical protein